MSGLLLQQGVNALTIGAIYALIALGYTMVYGVMRLINFAHGEMFMLGAYAALVAAGVLLPALGVPAAFIIVGIILFSFLIVGVIGVVTERVAYKPLRGASRLAPMLSALGLSLVLQAGMQIIAGPQPLAFPQIFESRSIEFAGAHLTSLQLIIVALCVMLMLALMYLVEKTRIGILIRAVAENHRTAALLGIDVSRVVSIVFLIGPGLGAVAGVFYASYYGVISPTMGVIVGLKAFTAAILGGIGSIPGAMLGGFLLGFLEVFGTALLPVLTQGYLGTEYRDVFAFAVLILVLLFKPAGLLGENVTAETAVQKREY
jgi:branched-chain amino acid transport system permease protein